MIFLPIAVIRIPEKLLMNLHRMDLVCSCFIHFFSYETLIQQRLQKNIYNLILYAHHSCSPHFKL